MPKWVLATVCTGRLTGARLQAGELQRRLRAGHVLLLGAALQPQPQQPLAAAGRAAVPPRRPRVLLRLLLLLGGSSNAVLLGTALRLGTAARLRMLRRLLNATHNAISSALVKEGMSKEAAAAAES